MAVTSLPDIWVTGAVHHYVRIPGEPGNAIYYLGTAEVTPQVQSTLYYQPVFNDIAGKTLPFQKTYDGEAAMVSVLFTRHSRIAWERLLVAGLNTDPQGLFGVANAGAVRSGTEGRWSRGHLVFGQTSFELWQVFDNAINPVNQFAAEIELGRYWPQVTLEREDKVAEGTQAEKLLLVFDCQPQWIPYAAGGSNKGGWKLYSRSPTDFPAAVTVPQ